ncbi:hypothetical protein FQN54_004801 [Arachnomyces sp. PD_36]|nr:hypothetical protein FQN54_004801 [Arachnomyces sp. PD_36]
MILSASVLLPPFFLHLLASSAVADGYPVELQNQVIRRSSRTPECGSLPQLVWRRCMVAGGDNCRGLDTETQLLDVQDQGSPDYADCDDNDEYEPEGDSTTSYPTKTVPRNPETETPIPTTELMRRTQESPSPVTDELDDDDEDIAAIPASATKTSGSHGTFLPRHTSSTCSLHAEPQTPDTCGGSRWNTFFNDTRSSDLRRFVTPELIALSLVVLFLFAVLVVEVSEGLWRFWNSGWIPGRRSGQVRLTGPEKTLLAVSDEKSGAEDSEYRDFPSGHDRERQITDES